MKLDFDKTEMSLAHKTDTQLKREQCLFSLINIPIVSPFAIKLTSFLSHYKVIPSFLFKKSLFKLFCGGETLDEAKRNTEDLCKKNISRVFFYSIEGNDHPETVKDIMSKTVDILKESDPGETYSAFKLTSLISPEILEKIQRKSKLSLEEQKSFNIFLNNFESLCVKAAELNFHLMVDAEESWFQETIDALCLQRMRKYNRNYPVVYMTLQMYRSDRLDYLKSLIEAAKKEGFYLGVKIVRGAYLYKEDDWARKHNIPTVIHSSKEETDKAYNKALELCFENLDHVALFAGTHNTQSIQIFADLVERYKNKKQYVMSSQLYGMCDFITFLLAHNNVPASKYIPFGPVKEVMPYLIRRAEENNSVLGEARREVELIKKERKRRYSYGMTN